ncbi:ATP-binding protein [Methanoplanus limicola]|uniref:ATPase n=1 Tax=Methanoplanus limicola DSM 2279 TaxID=937775 RepID=H1Z3W9_9EURY|nr:ATP-binding protein [Methanoplanus limicola]EHQ36591.1 hypothetical protein Metlim_2549 [Methanoplanus limicola DSM 2279]
MSKCLDLLVSLNPWWRGEMLKTGIIREKYFLKIRKYLDTGEILVLNGVRRSGKTTILFQTVDELVLKRGVSPEKILFVNCDDPLLLEFENPLETVIDTYRKDVYAGDDAWLILDEVQSIDGWERWIKSYYDRKMFKIIISGSSSYLMDSGLSALLSGRYLPVSVYPLDFSEYLMFKGFDYSDTPVALASDKYKIMNYLSDYLKSGGFPQVVLQDDDEMRNDYLRVYYDSIVYRDIVRIQNVRNQKALSSLLMYFFSNFTSVYSYKNLSDVLQIDNNTIHDYIHFAEMAKILFEVRYFSYSLKAQERNQKKIYCIDNGLRNSVSFAFSKDVGRLAENLVFVELMRRGFSPYYWKKPGTGKEADFVIKKRDGSLQAINVTYTDDIKERETAGLIEFSGEFSEKCQIGQSSVFTGAVDMLLLTKDTEGELDDGIRMVPLWKWLLSPDSSGSV